MASSIKRDLAILACWTELKRESATFFRFVESCVSVSAV